MKIGCGILRECKNDVKKAWYNINDILYKNRKDFTYPDTFKNGSANVSNDNDIAESFNDYFINIGPSLADKITTSGNADHFLGNIAINCSSMFMYPVSEDEFLTVASASLKPSKAARYDDFKFSIMKQELPYISKTLTHIFNLSFKKEFL